MRTFRKIETEIPDLFLIESNSFQDERGYFSEKYHEKEFQELGISQKFVQMNESFSKRGVLRGLHFQKGKPQGKLLRVIQGSVYDVVVDLRKNSSYYGKWFGVLLTEQDRKSLWIPEGFAHGFLSLEENTRIQYHCTEYYAPEEERGVLWSDITLGIDWKLEEFGISAENLILSDKDKKHPSFLEVMEEEQGSVLLLGAEGQLGKEFQSFFQKKEIAYIATDKDILDITDPNQSKEFWNQKKITTVINCAAYNEVDKAEKNENSCWDLNVKAIELWKELCQERGIPFLIFSSDFVFDGEQEIPYTEEDRSNPLSIYGKSKQKGEEIALEYHKSFIIRTSWLFGSGGKNFCQTVLDWMKEKNALYIVEDLISSPSYTKDLVEFSWELLEKKYYGLYHFSNSGEASKYEQVRYIASLLGWQGTIYKAKTEDFPSLAKRPKYSKLDSTKIEFTLQKKIPHWKIAIQEYLKEVGLL